MEIIVGQMHTYRWTAHYSGAPSTVAFTTLAMTDELGWQRAIEFAQSYKRRGLVAGACRLEKLEFRGIKP